MKSIIWKELRENLRWSLLAFLGMSVAMAAALQPDVRGLTVTSRNFLSVASEEFQLVTAIGCAVVGLALGLLQCVFEARGDRYSLLVHRPATRTAIFAAKVLAGGALYLFPTAVPFLLASWWAATPGHIPAPFAASMMLPGAIDILLGFAYYFAGLLTGLRAARWYASRGVGIAAAILFSCATVVIPSALVAALLALTGIALLLLAARGCFLTGGIRRAQPLVSRAAVGACLVISLSSVSFLVCVGAHVTARELRLTKPSRPGDVVVSGGYTILRDGRVLRGDRTLEGEPADFSPEEKVHPDSLGLAEYAEFPFEAAATNYRWRRRFPLLSQAPHAILFYDREEGLIHHYSYESGMVDFAGYLDPRTLRAQPEKPEKRLEYLGESTPYWRFTPESGWWYGGGRVLAFSDITLDWHENTLRTLFTVPDGGERIIAAGRLQESHHGRGWVPAFAYAALVTESEVLAFDENGGIVLRAPTVSDLSRFQSVGMARLDGDRFAVYFKAMHGADPETAVVGDEVIRIVSASGEVLDDHRLAPRTGRSPIPSRLSDHAGPGMPFPAMVLAWLEGRVRPHPTHSTLLERWYAFSAIAFLSALAAFAAARRNAIPPDRTWLWTGLAFVLGPAGLLTFLCLDDRPARERCQSCSRPRVVTRDACERCGAEWPAPTRDGTEVFESA